MGLQNAIGINQLTRLLPEGVAAPSSWLAAHGYSRQLVRKYVLSGWLTPLGHGAYARSGPPVGWEGVLLGLQRLGKMPCHLGGLSALNRQGLAHFLPLGGEQRIQVMSARKPPAWVRAANLAQVLVFDTRRLFADQARETGVVSLATGIRDWTLPMAGVERAVMEMLNDVGDNDSFQHAAQVFEGLTVLRPRVVNDMLAACRSIKVKRLFLFLAAHFDYPWAKRLETADLNLGRGNRQVVKGGRLDKRFLITVPERFGAESL
ncbi:MAG: type IV toxin-antitoxin system AbiEi family antitoxin domain-containing protein [Desulfatitalea sp.]